LISGQSAAHVSSIIVVSDDNYPPYVMRDSGGAIRGILVDQWKLWEKKTGIAVTLIAMDWGEAQRYMAGGHADVIDTMFLTEERTKLYDFSRPWARIEVPVFFHRNVSGIGDAQSLHGFTVGVKEGDAAVDFLKSRGVTTLELFPSYEAIVRAAAEGEIRVFCVDSPPAKYFLYKYNLEQEFRSTAPLYAGEFHRAVRKGNTALLRTVEEGFAKISAGEYASIERKWTGTPVLLPREVFRPLLYGATGGGLLALALILWIYTLRRQVASRTVQLRGTLEAQRQSEAQFRLLAENANDVIWTMDESGGFTYVSPSVRKLLGYTPSEILAQSLEEVLTETSLPVVQHVMKQFDGVFTEGIRFFNIPPIEVETKRKDDSTVWTETIVTPLLDKDGRLHGILGVSRDISERKQREEEQHTLDVQMQQTQKLESLGRLAGGIAHDFNNMLQVILGFCSMMKGYPDDKNAILNDLRVIEEAAQRAASLTQQLLAFSRKQVVQPKVFDLGELVKQSEKMLSRVLGEDIALTAVLGKEAACVRADDAQMQQVILNLALNARDAMPEGGRITISTENVALLEAIGHELPVGDYVRLIVHDTGHGMDSSTMDHLFEPFFTTKGLGKGTGLGLSIVYGIVKKWGGDIRVESEVGVGTTFTIHLPRIFESTDDIKAHTGEESQHGSASILLVEDEVSVRRLVRTILEKAGYTVTEAESGEEAIRVCRTHSEGFDLLITDIVLTGIHGPGVADAVRELFPEVLAIFMSGYADKGDAPRPNDVPILLKPFSAPTLLDQVGKILANKLCLSRTIRRDRVYQRSQTSYLAKSNRRDLNEL
jgi:two-component system sensor histidine kinase EvgS